MTDQMSDELTSEEMMRIALRASPLVSGVRVENDGIGRESLYIRIDEHNPNLAMMVISDVQAEINDRLQAYRTVAVKLETLRE